MRDLPTAFIVVAVIAICWLAGGCITIVSGDHATVTQTQTLAPRVQAAGLAATARGEQQQQGGGEALQETVAGKTLDDVGSGNSATVDTGAL